MRGLLLANAHFCSSDNDRLVDARLHVLGVASSSILLISGDVHDSASLNGKIGVTLSVTGSDLRALGIKSNGDLAAGLGSLGLAGIVDDRLVVLVRTVGEVHTDNVETSSSQLVDGLNRVRVGANCADDGGSSEVSLGGVGGIEGSQPLDAAIVGQVVGGGNGDRHGALKARHVSDLGLIRIIEEK